MPRYFFNVSDGKLSFIDERGKELSSLQEAHFHALGILEKMLHLIPDHVTASCKIHVITHPLASAESFVESVT